MPALASPAALPAPCSRRASLCAALAGALALAGCMPPIRPLSARMDRVLEPAVPGQRADTLLVLLPGAYDTPQDFQHQGFVQAVRQRQLHLGGGRCAARGLQPGLRARYSEKVPSSTCRSTFSSPAARSVCRMLAGGAQASMLSK